MSADSIFQNFRLRRYFFLSFFTYFSLFLSKFMRHCNFKSYISSLTIYFTKLLPIWTNLAQQFPVNVKIFKAILMNLENFRLRRYIFHTSKIFGRPDRTRASTGPDRPKTRSGATLGKYLKVTI